MTTVMKALLFACLMVFEAGCQHRLMEVGNLLVSDEEPAQVVADRPTLLRLKEGKHDFHALFGVDFKRGGNARLRVSNSSTNLALLQGWLYLDGSYPFGTTDIVTAGAEGT